MWAKISFYFTSSFRLRPENPEKRKGSGTIGWENLGEAGIVVMVVVEAVCPTAGRVELSSTLCCTDVT